MQRQTDFTSDNLIIAWTVTTHYIQLRFTLTNRKALYMTCSC